MTAAERIYNRLDVIATYTEVEGEITRPFGSDSMHLLYKLIDNWAVEDGIDFSVDNMANIRLRSKRHDANKKTFVSGSHVDSVVNAGKYDGPLGFLIAYEMLLFCDRQEGSLPFNLETIGFCDEEGVRFQTTYLGSSAVAGKFKTEWLKCTDKDGVELSDALTHFGCNPRQLESCVIAQQDWIGYYEVHIEQGPVLQEENLSVGIVQNIYGQIRIVFELIGFAGHAGTVPMHMRKDALTGLAECIQYLEHYGIEHKDDLVGTVGQCSVLPGASNVIPGQIQATIDMRSHDMALLNNSVDKIRNQFKSIATRRGLELNWSEVQRNEPVYCDETLNSMLIASVDEKLGRAVTLSSGAGHDGVAISKVAPISMLFVRCRDGISHNPLEYASFNDVSDALDVSILYITKLIKNYSK